MLRAGILAFVAGVLLYFVTGNKEPVYGEEKHESKEDPVARIIRELTYTPPIECTSMTATAYSNDPVSVNVPAWRDGHTSSLLKAARGTVAVDPKVIPLGSVLFVEGYGYAVALDTGKAIKGYRIDLFFETRRQALEFGKREVLVCILGRIDYRKSRTLEAVAGRYVR